MNIHRMRSTPAPDGEAPYLWAETEPDVWMEIDPGFKMGEGIHDALHGLIKDDDYRGLIKYAERAFRIGLVKGPITEMPPIVGD